MTRFAMTLSGTALVALIVLGGAASAQNPASESPETPAQDQSQSNDGNPTNGAPERQGRAPSRDRDEDAETRQRNRETDQRQSEPLDQPSEPEDAQDSRTDPLANPARERTQTEATEADVEAEARRGQFLRASSFIGMPVRGTGGAQLGSVADVLIDPGTANVSYVLIDRDGGPVSPQLPVVPWSLFQTNIQGVLNLESLTVPLTRERLQSAPAASMTDDNLTPGGQWLSTVDEFYSTDLRQVSRPDLDTNAEDGNAPQTPGITDTPDTIQDRRQSAGTATDPSSQREDRSPTTEDGGGSSSNRAPNTARSRPSTGSLERDRTDRRGSGVTGRDAGGSNRAGNSDSAPRDRGQGGAGSSGAGGSGASRGSGTGAGGAGGSGAAGNSGSTGATGSSSGGSAGGGTGGGSGGSGSGGGVP